MDRIAVLIPCYNESQTITKVVTDFRKTLPEAVIYGLTQAFPAGSGSRFAACFFFCWPRMTT